MNSMNSKPILWALVLSSVLLIVKGQFTDSTWIESSTAPYCGGTLTGWGQFTSPNYPNNYNIWDYCVWVITNENANERTYIFFRGFNIQNFTDFVEVRDGPYDTSPLIRRLTGRIVGGIYIESTSNILWVLFYTGGFGIPEKGFIADYGSYNPTTPFLELSTEPEPVHCGQDFNQYSGIFSSPNYPANYPNHADCIWRINVTYGEQVYIYFDEAFQTESSNDYLYIRDGPNSDSFIIAGYTGSIAYPVPTVSSTSQVYIEFHSDQSNTARGFSAGFYGVFREVSTEPYQESKIETPSCSEDLEEDSGMIQSPNYPANYPDNADCIWRINATAGLKIGMQIGFDMRLESKYDFLEIRDGPNSDSTILKTYTGTIQFPAQIISTGSSLWVWFHSDDGKNEKGFTANFAGGRDKSQIEDLLHRS